jgi:hypothetical protein
MSARAPHPLDYMYHRDELEEEEIPIPDPIFSEEVDALVWKTAQFLDQRRFYDLFDWHDVAQRADDLEFMRDFATRLNALYIEVKKDARSRGWDVEEIERGAKVTWPRQRGEGASA